MKNKGLLLTIIAILALSLMVMGCGGGADTGGKTADEDVIKIGFLGAKTGGHAIYGINTLKGMKMAADELNANGGVLGKQIVIVEEDHGSKPSEGASVVQKLINRENVVAIVGDPTTGITKVAAPIAEQNKVVMVSAGATGLNVVNDEQGNLYEYIYRNTLLDSVAAPAVVKYIKETEGWETVALITSINNDYSVMLSSVFKEALIANGIEIVAEESVQDGDQNFSAQVTSIKAKNPDGIVFSGYYTEGGLIMREVRNQGMNDITMVGGDGLQAPVLWELGGDAVVGVMSYSGFEADPSTATGKTKALIERTMAEHGQTPDLFIAQGYDAVMMIAYAMEQANSADPTEFKEEIKKITNWEGASGTITILDNHEPMKSPVYLLEVAEGAGGMAFQIKAIIPVN